MNTNGKLLETLARSAMFESFERAFTDTTGLPVALRPLETWQLPFHGKRRENAFCALVAGTSRACAACLQLQKKLAQAAILYLIRSGRVALEAHEPANGNAPIQTLGAGDVLGWSWLFPPFVWHFQARALEPARAIALSGAHLLAMAEKHPDFGHALMKRVAQVVIHRLQTTRKRLLERQIESIFHG